MIRPPAGGRAPGWNAGLATACRQHPYDGWAGEVWWVPALAVLSTASRSGAQPGRRSQARPMRLGVAARRPQPPVLVSKAAGPLAWSGPGVGCRHRRDSWSPGWWRRRDCPRGCWRRDAGIARGGGRPAPPVANHHQVAIPFTGTSVLATLTRAKQWLPATICSAWEVRPATSGLPGGPLLPFSSRLDRDLRLPHLGPVGRCRWVGCDLPSKTADIVTRGAIVQAAVVHQFKAPLQLEEVPVPSRARVRSCEVEAGRPVPHRHPRRPRRLAGQAQAPADPRP